MSTKKRQATNGFEDDDPVEPDEELLFLNLGGGNEVGRSCHVIQYKGKTVMVCALLILEGQLANYKQLDAGQHAGYDGLSALPFFDEFDLSTIDVLLISQYVHPAVSSSQFLPLRMSVTEQVQGYKVVQRRSLDHDMSRDHAMQHKSQLLPLIPVGPHAAACQICRNTISSFCTWRPTLL